VNAYLNLLRTPGVARIIAAQLTARLPSGMISLGFLLRRIWSWGRALTS